jgi:hypothetical protein
LYRTFANACVSWFTLGEPRIAAAGGGLLLQGFAQIFRSLSQLIEQARVLDGDDGLGSKVLDQLDLFVRERQHFGAIDKKRTNQLLPFEQWHAD